MALTLPGHRRFAPMYKNIPDVFVFAAFHGAPPPGQCFALFTKRQDSRFAQLQLPKANIRDDVSENLSRRFCIRAIPGTHPPGHRRCAPMFKNIPDVFYRLSPIIPLN
jgi:hypothetical protein